MYDFCRSTDRCAAVAHSVALGLIALAAGCGRTSKADPVDVDRARQALVKMLESWQQGAKPDTLRNATPALTVQDFDWIAGCHLLHYEMLKDRNDGLMWRCEVKLTLRDPRGQQLEKQVAYVIATSPVTTVFREMNM
jgi:hypothetical protein